MATISRQPFAPLDEARLQSLTSIKNRQNAISPQSNIKRKADLLGIDDCENFDPLISAKRPKGLFGTPSKDSSRTPSSFVVAKTVITPSTNVRALVSPIRASTAPRRTLQPKSPSAKLNTTNLTKSSPTYVPAGRSPTHGKRSGILSSRRRTDGPYTRVEPPLFALNSDAPFSLDAALKGTIPSYRPRPRSNALSAGTVSSPPPPRNSSAIKASWFFDIHEDTPEQEMTNLLQHNTCVLDISSDEESEQKTRREKAEGRDKENVPPPDDVSQMSARRALRAALVDPMAMEKDRVALGEMKTTDFYADGCDETSVIMVPADDENAGHQQQQQQQQQQPPRPVKPRSKHVVETASTMDDSDQLEPVFENMDPLKAVDLLMAKSEPTSKAAVLQPIEGTGESFDLWESDSTKDDGEAAATGVGS